MLHETLGRASARPDDNEQVIAAQIPGVQNPTSFKIQSLFTNGSIRCRMRTGQKAWKIISNRKGFR